MYILSLDLVLWLGSGRFLDHAELDHLFGHVHHSLVEGAHLDAKTLDCAVVKLGHILFRVDFSHDISDRVSKGLVLGDEGSSIFVEAWRLLVDDHEALASRLLVLGGEDVGFSNLTHIATRHMLSWDLGHSTGKNALNESSRRTRCRGKRRSHHERRQNCGKFELLLSWKVLHKFPSGFLSKDLRLGVVFLTGLGFGPVGFCKFTVRSVCLRNTEDT